MIIGSHDTMTANSPKNWVGYITLPFSRCQSKSVKELYDLGVRCFDLRVSFRNGEPIFKHSIVKFKGSPHETIKEINKLGDCYVRVLLEDIRDIPENEQNFKELCKFWEDTYTDIKFFQGNRRCDWKQVYTFENNPTLVQHVGSMADDARWYEKLIPWTYAKRNNKKYLDKEEDYDIALFDFL